MKLQACKNRAMDAGGKQGGRKEIAVVVEGLCSGKVAKKNQGHSV